VDGSVDTGSVGEDVVADGLLAGAFDTVVIVITVASVGAVCSWPPQPAVAATAKQSRALTPRSLMILV